MVYNYKKQRTPIVPMYTIRGSADTLFGKNGGNASGANKQIRKIEDTPAPNTYSLPDMIGKTVQSNKPQAPCYTMTSRWWRYSGRLASEDCSPGPKYSITDPNIFLRKAPLYSFATRNMMPGDNIKKPGPGTHSPELVTRTRHASPSYSFGIRHSLPRAPIIVDMSE